MFTYKKYIFLSLICLLTATAAGAQGNVSRHAAKLRKFPANIQVSKTLADRVQNTYQAALRTQPHHTLEFITEAANNMRPRLVSNLNELYPEAVFLSNSKQVTDYFLARNNRNAIAYAATHQQRLTQIQQHLNEFEKGRKSIKEGEEVRWIAGQIPSETSCLFLGEYHHVFDIHLTIANLLSALREQNPNRPLILLTEFLPEQSILGKTTTGLDMPDLLPIWAAAQKAHIPVLGLEPEFLFNNAGCMLCEKKKKRGNIWASYEGMRLRNTRWAFFITNFRQTMARVHPELNEALFIVYAGAAHTGYHAPYSLATLLPDEKIFSVAFFPLYRDRLPHDYHTSDFDRMTNGLFATERLLQFTDPELAKLAGFDIRLKVEPVHQISKIGIIVSNTQ